jgi:hypothetical protein
LLTPTIRYHLCGVEWNALTNETLERILPNYNSMLGSVAAMTAAPGAVQECRLGSPEHHKGPSGEIPFYPAIKFEFVINLKAIRALNLTMPPSLLAIADEVIE